MSKLLLPCEASQNDVEKRCGEIVKTLRKLQGNWHTVNKLYIKQLVDFCCSVLPAAVNDFNNLSANQVSALVHMNDAFVSFMQLTMLGQFVWKP